MLGFDGPAWLALPWWLQRAYVNGLQWEVDNGGWRVQRVIPIGSGNGGGGNAPAGQFVPLDSLESRAAEGIDTGTIYQ